jgi:hypothetical protein
MSFLLFTITLLVEAVNLKLDSQKRVKLNKFIVNHLIRRMQYSFGTVFASYFLLAEVSVYRGYRINGANLWGLN